MKTSTLFLNKNTELTKNCKVCTNFFERARGLLFRAPLTKDANDALLIPKCNSIHTFWMKYPIAVIFLDNQKKVLAIHANVEPRKVIAQKKSKFALEVAIDTIWLDQIKIGSELYWQ